MSKSEAVDSCYFLAKAEKRLIKMRNVTADEWSCHDTTRMVHNFVWEPTRNSSLWVCSFRTDKEWGTT